MINIRNYILESGFASWSEPDQLLAVEHGIKRIAIVKKIYTYQTFLSKLEIPGTGRVIVFQETNKEIAKAAFQLITMPHPNKYKDSEYHRALGELLDYTPSEIKKFLKKLGFSG